MNNFSPNMLKTFEECPQKYYFRYIQKISAPQKSSPFEKGKKIHALANYYHRNEDITKLEKLLTTEENILWDKLKNNEYFTKNCVNSEYTLSCKVNNFWVGGRLDALVKDEQSYYILDYKTGAIPKTPEFDYQTMVYLLAVSEFYKNNIQLSFIYIDLKNDKNHKIDYSSNLRNEYTTKIDKICTTIEKTKEFSRNENSCRYCEFKKLCHPSF